MTETYPLNTGTTIPVLGFGVYQSSPEDTADAVTEALKVGYRHIDTAAAYQNERQVGEALRRSGIDREDIFIETKVWASDFGHAETLHAFEKSRAKLGLDYIDLLILHQPMPQRFARTLDGYKVLEELYADGLVRAIGVSNFMPQHLEDLTLQTEIVPAVNQIEAHPYFQQRAVEQADTEFGILTQAWSPIGGITFYTGDSAAKSTLQDSTIGQIAAAHGKTPAQVMLRWHLQQGRQVIPKSTTPSRIAENFDVFDFVLTTQELSAVDILETGARGGPDPDVVDPLSFGITIPDV